MNKFLTTTLLIDYDIIPNGAPLIKHIERLNNSPVPIRANSDENIGIILTLPKTLINNLEKIPIGKARVAFISSQKFLDGITGCGFIIYNSGQKQGEIMCINSKILAKVLSSLQNNFPDDTLLWAKFSPNRAKLNLYSRHGFKNTFAHNGYIYVARVNSLAPINEKFNLEYTLKTNRSKFCTQTVCLSTDTISYLEKLCQAGSTLNKNGTISQKEIAGQLMPQYQQDKNKNLYTGINANVTVLKVDKSSIVVGKEESVSFGVNGLYVFHSHPKSAYDNHNSKYGWPSVQDYIGFYYSKSILHVVATVEGVYFISRATGTAKVSTRYIRKHYNIPHIPHTPNNNDQLKQYIEKVNSHPVFRVVFLSWKNAGANVSINYDKSCGNNCFWRNGDRRIAGRIISNSSCTPF